MSPTQTDGARTEDENAVPYTPAELRAFEGPGADRLKATANQLERLLAGYQMLLPGLILDLRYADDDDDKDAMRCRIQTVEEALS